MVEIYAFGPTLICIERGVVMQCRISKKKTGKENSKFRLAFIRPYKRRQRRRRVCVCVCVYGVCVGVYRHRRVALHQVQSVHYVSLSPAHVNRQPRQLVGCLSKSIVLASSGVRFISDDNYDSTPAVAQAGFVFTLPISFPIFCSFFSSFFLPLGISRISYWALPSQTNKVLKTATD
jgi:hypothetical protein